jgi:Domain of unknown function (DUF6973)
VFRRTASQFVSTKSPHPEPARAQRTVTHGRTSLTVEQPTKPFSVPLRLPDISLPSIGHVTADILKAVASHLGLKATNAEIAYAVAHPEHAVQTLTIAGSLFEFVKIAAAKPYRAWGKNYDLTNGAPDAFLHAAWAGLVALRYGPSYATTVTTLHETGTPQRNLLERNARRMDLNNNSVGIALAEAIRASPPQESAHFDSFGGLAHNAAESELLSLLFRASQPGTTLKSNLQTLGPPGASERQVKRNPVLYRLDSDRPVRH